MQVFALDASRSFGECVAACLGRSLAAHEERGFEDGEHKSRPLDPVRGRDVYVIQSLYGGPDQSADEKLCRLLFFVGAVRDAGAARVTCVVPYLAYARKDRRTKPRAPVTTRYVAQLLEAIGADAIVSLDVHNVAAFDNAFRCRADHLDSRMVFARPVADLVGDGQVVVASPDPGGVKRAQLFRETVERVLGRPVGAAFADKRRSAGVVTGELLVGDVGGAAVVIVDDLISTGGTMRRCAETCLTQGATRVFAVAAHGLFTSGAEAAIGSPALARTLITDTVPPFRLPAELVERRVTIVSAAPLFAEAIRRCHSGGSINDLLEHGA
jgi:ribose-phosphate pyrophosphokinase